MSSRGVITRHWSLRLRVLGAILLVIGGGIWMIRKLSLTASPHLKNATDTITKLASEAIGQDTTGGTTTITVDARRMWTDTGVQVIRGDRVTIEASGQVNGCTSAGDAANKWVSPDGWGYQPQFFVGGKLNLYALPLGSDSSLMALIGKVGEHGKPFKVGSHLIFTARQDGMFYLGINDGIKDYLGKPITSNDHIVWKDNDGAFTVRIHHKSMIETATFTVDATQPGWQPTGVMAAIGDKLNFQASGKVVWDKFLPAIGPDGAGWTAEGLSQPSEFPLPQARCGSLIGKVGTDIFFIGSKRTKIAQTSGELFLTINERSAPHHWTDNIGSFQLTLKRK